MTVFQCISGLEMCFNYNPIIHPFLYPTISLSGSWIFSCFFDTPFDTPHVFFSLFVAVIKDLSFKPKNSSEMIPNYDFNIVFNDRNCDLSKRWYISFYVWHAQKQKVIKKWDYKVNKLATPAERRKWAKNRIEDIKNLLEQGYHIDENKYIEDKILTVVDGLEYAQKIQTVSHATKLSYKSVVKLFLEWAKNRHYDALMINQFDVKMAYKYRDHLQGNGKSGVTINNDISCLKRMWNLLKKRELVNENPWTKLEKEKAIVTNRNIAYTWNEVGTLSEIIPVTDPELWKFVSIMYHTFARPNEIRQMQVYNIQLQQRKIFLEAHKTKSKKDRWINIHDSLIDILIELIKNKSAKDYLFPGTKEMTCISKNRMTDRMSSILDKCGLADGEHTLYSWKHTGVIQAYLAGVDIKSIQLQCGHSSITETDRYLKSLGLYNNHEVIIKQPPLPLK